MLMSEKMSEEFLKDTQKLYNQGKWQTVINLIDTFFTSSDEQQIAEANKLEAWSYYYLGIKGEKSKKIENLEKAENNFKSALEKVKKNDIKISIMNGLPLVLWILDKKEEAWKVSNKAIKEFEKVPSVWNTRSILARWAEDFEKTVELCEKVYETAKKNKDYRVVGHGKHNQGDAFVKLDEREKALESYQKAEEMYVKDGKSAFHLEAVRDKIRNIEK